MSNSFKILAVWTSKIESQMAMGYLESKGFHPRLNGAKEYSSHVTGMDIGRYEISVPENEVDGAHTALAEIKASAAPENSESFGNDEKYRRKAIYTFVLSILILPIIGNIMSFHYAWKIKSGRYVFARMTLFILNAIVMGFFLYFLLQTYILD